VRITEIEKFSEPLRLEHIMKLYPGWSRGHGPYIWYKSDEFPDKEIWFWFEQPEKEIQSSEYKVVLVTIVNSDDPDELKIIWPKRYLSKDIKEVFNSIYKY
jgi:hypothetical protein